MFGTTANKLILLLMRFVVWLGCKDYDSKIYRFKPFCEKTKISEIFEIEFGRLR